MKRVIPILSSAMVYALSDEVGDVMVGVQEHRGDRQKEVSFLSLKFLSG